MPKPTCQDALFLGRARSSVASRPGSHVGPPPITPTPLCWNMTCKYQTLALVTSPNTAHLRADASGKCLPSPQYVGETHPVPCSPYLPARRTAFVEAKSERCQPGFCFFGLCQSPSRALFKANERLRIQMLVRRRAAAEQTVAVFSTA